PAARYQPREHVRDQEADQDHYRAENHPSAEFQHLVENPGQFGKAQQPRRRDGEEQDDRDLGNARDHIRRGRTGRQQFGGCHCPVEAQPGKHLVEDLRHEPADEIADRQQQHGADDPRDGVENQPQHVAGRLGDAFELERVEREDREEYHDYRIDDRADGLADGSVARGSIHPAAIGPFVEIDRVEEGDGQVADDLGHQQADEEQQSRTDQIGNEIHHIVEQRVDRPGHIAEAQHRQDDQQTEQPDQQADDLAELHADAFAAGRGAAEQRDIVDQLGKAPFGGLGRRPGHDQDNGRQGDLLRDLERKLLIEAVIADTHGSLLPVYDWTR